MELTKKQKQAYLKDPSKCPVCRCIRIELLYYRFLRNPKAWKVLCCLNPKCKVEFTDTYTLTDVEIIEKEGT